MRQRLIQFARISPLFAVALFVSCILTFPASAHSPSRFAASDTSGSSVAETAASIAAETDDDDVISPSGTYMFAARDTCELYLDVYDPAPGSETTFDGKDKPAILFVFGGGFISGRRDYPGYVRWFQKLTENGYRIISIDYRLGLKGVKSVGATNVGPLDNAIHLAVEDLYSATAFLIDNADALGINPRNIVLCGSSAGAITILQAEYELCNRSALSGILPADFQYAGLMSFSGAILSREGNLVFDSTPAPTLFFHGTKDKLVTYKQIKFFKLGFFGSDKIVQRLKKFGFTYNIRRYKGNRHEIANIMNLTVPEQTAFIEENIILGKPTIIDTTIVDPDIPVPAKMSQTRKQLYN